MNLIVTAYWIYIIVLIGLSVWVARTMHRNTRTFLLEIFTEHENVAVAVNNLLQTGFYLIAFGFGFLRLRIGTQGHDLHFMETHKELVEVLAVKLGAFTLFIGALLFFNLFLMLSLRKGAKNNRLREQQTRIWMEKQQQQQAATYPTNQQR